MNPHPRLFYDSFEDAARDVVSALGGPKEVGVKLWPAKTADAARSRLLDCLNADRPEKFDPCEIVTLAAWGREVGCHALIDYLTAEAGYTKPSPLAPEDEAAELQRRFVEAVRESKRIADRLERMGALPSVRAS